MSTKKIEVILLVVAFLFGLWMIIKFVHDLNLKRDIAIHNAIMNQTKEVRILNRNFRLIDEHVIVKDKLVPVDEFERYIDVALMKFGVQYDKEPPRTVKEVDDAFQPMPTEKDLRKTFDDRLLERIIYLYDRYPNKRLIDDCVDILIMNRHKDGFMDDVERDLLKWVDRSENVYSD